VLNIERRKTGQASGSIKALICQVRFQASLARTDVAERESRGHVRHVLFVTNVEHELDRSDRSDHAREEARCDDEWIKEG
jgi:hypothetical protein